MGYQVGIGICTYNRLDVLQKCLKSIEEKTDSKHKLIISSDGSTDGTDEWLKQQSYSWITNPNRGVAKNKNRLLDKLDDCDYIFIVEDDIAIKNKEWIDWYIKTSQESGYQHFSYHNKFRRARKNSTPYNTTTVVRASGTTGHLMFFTKEVLKRCGGFNEKYIGHGYEHLEYSKRINLAFKQGPLFLDSMEGNLCLQVKSTTSSVSASNVGKNGKLYKYFKKRYKKHFHKFCYCPYKE